MKLLKHITPLVVTATGFIIILVRYILGNDVAEVKSSMAFIALPVIAGCVIADIVVKKIFKQKLLWIWITEILLLLIVLYLWIIAA